MKNPKVLFIDDEMDLIINLSEILKHMGYEASIAINGNQGLWALKKNSFDVVVLDLRMPGISGMDVLREINPALKTSPEVIVLTGFASVESGLEGFRNGACNYLTKPVKMKELVESITEAWQRKLQKTIEFFDQQAQESRPPAD